MQIKQESRRPSFVETPPLVNHSIMSGYGVAILNQTVYGMQSEGCKKVHSRCTNKSRYFEARGQRSLTVAARKTLPSLAHLFSRGLHGHRILIGLVLGGTWD